jgi:hypothetical protein
MCKLFSTALSLSFFFWSFAQSPKAASSVFKDSVVTPASTRYGKSSFLTHFFLGKNYRKEWSTPVKLPVFNITKLGLKIKELGGGQQTKSLRLIDKNEKEWVLRTVDKDVEKAVPTLLRNTLVERVTQNMISAAHPYAPLTIPDLAKATGVFVAKPIFYFVPDDPALAPYQKLFANKVCMLEEREPTPDNTDTKSTEKVLEDIIDENDHLVIQKAVLRARLLDMLIGDWDRHADQWRWASVKSGNVEYYYAVPRDRDQAYFYSRGLLARISILMGSHFVGFSPNLKKIKNLNDKSWGFDGTFINELDKQEWRSVITTFQKNLTDDVISKAVRKFPSDIYAISGPVIENKLRRRRDELLEYGLKYYDFLARTVTISGSNDKELFEISNTNNLLTVAVFNYANNKKGRKIYERTFVPKETYNLILKGLDGNDKFVVNESTSSKIDVFVYGGDGDDTYERKGKLRLKVLD